MKTQNFLTAILIAVLIYFVFTGAKEKSAASDIDTIHTKKFELIDDKGKIRASILVEESGETMFRLKDSKGEIRVKPGASENGSGLLLLNCNTEPGIQALAEDKTTSITITDAAGKTQIIQP